MMKESRRSFLFSVVWLWQAASLHARQQHNHAGARPAEDSTLLFLDPRRHAVLVGLMDRFVPADERSTGAAGAKVDAYIDFVLAHADAALQRVWRTGLDRYGMALESKTGDAIDAFLQHQARREFSPTTDDERFFVYLKVAVTEGFYTSEEGIMKELGYRGMTFNLDFVGCTHAEHKAPADYKPLLRSAEKA